MKKPIKYYTVNLVIAIVFVFISVVELLCLSCVCCQLHAASNEENRKKATGGKATVATSTVLAGGSSRSPAKTNKRKPDHQRPPVEPKTESEVEYLKNFVKWMFLFQSIDLVVCIILLIAIIKEKSILLLIYIFYSIITIVGKTVMLCTISLTSKNLEVTLCLICWWMATLIFYTLVLVVETLHYLEIK